MNLPGLPSISGMVKVAANHFLVVHDTKGPVGARLGVISVQKDGARYQDVDIHEWPSFEALPNDIEDICEIPDRPNEYLIVESGFYQSKYGRVIKIRYPGGSVSGAEYMGAFRPFAPPIDGDTPRHEHIEGIASVVFDRTMTLVFALRGAQNSPGTLVWGTLVDIETPRPSFYESCREPLSHCAIANRGAAALFLRPYTGSANSWEVLSVATLDPDDNLGPFLSAIYSAGVLTATSGKIEFKLHSPCNVLWHVQGMKVEALAAPAESIGKSELSIATDDEFYQGVWRPLPPSKGPQIPSKMLFVENVLAASKSK